jgi:uncharacterized protein (TIGR00369 family)
VSAVAANGAVASAGAHATAAPQATRRREVVWQDPVALAARGRAMRGIDYARGIAAGELPPPPIAVLMRMGIDEVEPGRIVFSGEPAEEHYNPIGVVHGGYAATLLDSAMGMAVHTTLELGEAYSTLSIEVKYVRPIVAETRVLAIGEMIHRGRRQATAAARLVDAAGDKLLAHASSTLMILS